MNIHAKPLLQALDRPIAFQRSFVRLTGSVTASLMLSQAIYWSLRSQGGDGWFWKTERGWEEETGLTRRAQDSARKLLRGLGLMEEEKRGMPAKIWFRVDEEILAHRLAESANQAWRKAPTKDGGKRQPILGTESTTETTKQIQTPLPPLQASGGCSKQESEAQDGKDGGNGVAVERVRASGATPCAGGVHGAGNADGDGGGDARPAGAGARDVLLRPLPVGVDGAGQDWPLRDAVRRVMVACGWVNRRLRPAVAEAIVLAMERGDFASEDEVARRMIENWLELKRAGALGLLRYAMSPRKFIADAHWGTDALWPYDPAKLAGARRAAH